MRFSGFNSTASTLGVSPFRVTINERLDEIAAILAAGLIRLRAKQSNCSPAGDVSLDFSGDRSVHPTENIEPAEAQ